MKEKLAKKILSQTVSNYNRLSVSWDRTRQNLWPEAVNFLSYIKPDDKVLDLGCGNGRLVKLFNDVNVEYFGIDNSEELVQIAKTNFPGRKFLVGDALKIPFADNSFDHVFCIAVLHHLPSKQLRQKVLDEIYRVLKPGGNLFMQNWDYRSPKFFTKVFKASFEKIFKQSGLEFGGVYIGWGDTDVKRFVHLFTLRGMIKILNKSGFKVVENYLSDPSKRGYKNIVTIGKK